MSDKLIYRGDLMGGPTTSNIITSTAVGLLREQIAEQAATIEDNDETILKLTAEKGTQAATIERLTAEISEYQTLAKRLVTDTTSRWALDQLIIKALEQTP